MWEALDQDLPVEWASAKVGLVNGGRRLEVLGLFQGDKDVYSALSECYRLGRRGGSQILFDFVGLHVGFGVSFYCSGSYWRDFSEGVIC